MWGKRKILGSQITPLGKPPLDTRCGPKKPKTTSMRQNNRHRALLHYTNPHSCTPGAKKLTGFTAGGEEPAPGQDQTVSEKSAAENPAPSHDQTASEQKCDRRTAPNQDQTANEK